MTKVDVYEQYKHIWKELITEVSKEMKNNNIPNRPVAYSHFITWWAADFPTLRIASSGSDLCDLCTNPHDLENLERIFHLLENSLPLQVHNFQ